MPGFFIMNTGILQNLQKVVYTLWELLPAAPFSAGMPLPLPEQM
jgi:hypothetical protein